MVKLSRRSYPLCIVQPLQDYHVISSKRREGGTKRRRAQRITRSKISTFVEIIRRPPPFSGMDASYLAPPRTDRSVHAAFPHTAPTSGVDGSSLPYASQRPASRLSGACSVGSHSPWSPPLAPPTPQ